MNMGTENTCYHNVAFNSGSDKHNVSSTVHNQHIIIFQQERVAIINTDWYFGLLEAFLWLNGSGRYPALLSVGSTTTPGNMIYTSHLPTV